MMKNMIMIMIYYDDDDDDEETHDDNDNDHDYDDEHEHEDGDIIEFYQVDIPVSRSDLSVLTMIGPWWYIPSPKGARGAMAIHLPYLSC